MYSVESISQVNSLVFKEAVVKIAVKRGYLLDCASIINLSNPILHQADKKISNGITDGFKVSEKTIKYFNSLFPGFSVEGIAKQLEKNGASFISIYLEHEIISRNTLSYSNSNNYKNKCRI